MSRAGCIHLTRDDLAAILDIRAEHDTPWEVLAADEGVEVDALRKAAQEFTGHRGVWLRAVGATPEPAKRGGEGRIITAAFIAEVATRRQRGETNAQIAAALQVSQPTVARAAVRWQEANGRPLPRRHSIVGIKSHLGANIVPLRRAGRTYAEISREVGLSPRAVRDRLRRHLELTGEDLTGPLPRAPKAQKPKRPPRLVHHPSKPRTQEEEIAELHREIARLRVAVAQRDKMIAHLKGGRA